jgi:hypothetical protein
MNSSEGGDQGSEGVSLVCFSAARQHKYERLVGGNEAFASREGSIHEPEVPLRAPGGPSSRGARGALGNRVSLNNRDVPLCSLALWASLSPSY